MKNSLRLLFIFASAMSCITQVHATPLLGLPHLNQDPIQDLKSYTCYCIMNAHTNSGYVATLIYTKRNSTEDLSGELCMGDAFPTAWWNCLENR